MRVKYLAILVAVTILTPKVNAQKKNHHILIGTYTSGSTSEGIYTYDFNLQTGESTQKSKVNVNNPSYLAVSADDHFVYSVSEDSTNNINAFAYNSSSGSLSYLNKQVSGDGPAYISVDSSRKYVFSANYSGGSLSAVPIKEDGSLGNNIQTIKHKGGSVNKFRQDKPYVHSVVLSPDNKYLLVQDLGTDKVYIYRFNPQKKADPLSPAEQSFIKVRPGSGPRHLTFHPNGKYAYLINELSSTVTVFQYNSGKLKTLQTVSLLPEDFNGKAESADIHLSPDGKFLYASNRDPLNDVVIFSVNEENGKLNFVGRQHTHGKGARTFAIDPSGRFLLSANTGSDSISIFKRNKKTGLITSTEQEIIVANPSSLKFVKID